MCLSLEITSFGDNRWLMLNGVFTMGYESNATDGIGRLEERERGKKRDRDRDRERQRGHIR